MSRVHVYAPSLRVALTFNQLCAALSTGDFLTVVMLCRALDWGVSRLTVVMLWAWQHKVEASGQVHEYDVENVIHSTSKISPMHLQKPALVSE